MTDKRYRIVELHSENVKRLKAVTIKPTGNVVEISGENRNGKSSVLDSIWYALGGDKAVPENPIRKGQKKAQTTIKLDGLVVRRTFHSQEDGSYTTSVIVESEEGFRANKPQKTLDQLIGQLSFDPIEFVDMSEKEQFEILKRFVPDFDFDAEALTRKDLVSTRTDVNRSAKNLIVQANAIVVPDDVPEAKIDIAGLLEQRTELELENASIERTRWRLNNLVADANRQESRAEEYLEQAAETRRRMELQIADLEKKASEAHAEAKEVRHRIEEIGELPERKSLDGLTEQINSATRLNDLVSKREQRDSLLADAKKLEEESDQLTQKIGESDDRKRKAIESSNIPVKGISFGENRILLNELPFEQASQAEQIEASMELAIAANPRLRVLLIRQGALLDKKAFAAVEKLAEKHDFQIWIEVVESGRQNAIIIEDGQVKGAADEA